MFDITINSSSAEKMPADKIRFLQSPLWGCFKSRHGWKNSRLFIEAYSGQTGFFSFECSVLIRDLGKKPFIFPIVYIPMQPEVLNISVKNDIDEENKIIEQLDIYCSFLIEFAKALKTYIPKNSLCIRYDPPLDFYDRQQRDFYVASLKNFIFFKRLNLKKTNTDIQPPDTVIIDLSKSLEDIFKLMKPKWRYNIRLAEKKGLEIKKINAQHPDFEKSFEAFYYLFEITSQRDKVAFHSKQYYRDLLELSADFSNSSEVSLYIAEHAKDVIAGIIVLFSKKEAVYLYGASGNVKRNFMPAYLLQWTAIQDAKNYGAEIYDFYGIPPCDDENHPMHGLYRFKTGFGGKIIHRAGTIDVPMCKMYKFYILLENIRAFWYKKIIKKISGR